MAAFQSFQVSVGTTPTPIAALPSGSYSVAITNSGAQSVFVGAAGVTTGGGHAVLQGTTTVLPVQVPSGGATLYGIVAATTATVTVLTGG
jgi:hypothetical protein